MKDGGTAAHSRLVIDRAVNAAHTKAATVRPINSNARLGAGQPDKASHTDAPHISTTNATTTGRLSHSAADTFTHSVTWGTRWWKQRCCQPEASAKSFYKRELQTPAGL